MEKNNNRILLVSNIIWGFAFFRIGLIRSLVAQDYEVICVGEFDNFSSSSVKIIQEAGAKCIAVKLSRKGLNPFKELFFLFQLYKIFKTNRTGLVINYSIKPIVYCSMVAMLLRIPSFSVFPGLGQGFISNNFINKVLVRTYKFCLRFNSKVFLINKDDVNYFLEKRLVTQDKIVYLPSEGINTIDFAPITRKKSKDKIIFLLIARLFKEKGIHEFVEAAEFVKSKYQNVEFQILGFIDLENKSAVRLEELNQWESKGWIKYLGKTDNVKIFIAEASCIVLPSYYREGVPRSLLEAASMAKPIITSNHIGCKEVVDDMVTGYLCEPRNALDLIRKIEEFIHLPEEKKRTMGELGRIKIIREFDEKIVNGVYLTEIHKML